jgi:hypothetical protein
MHGSFHGPKAKIHGIYFCDKIFPSYFAHFDKISHQKETRLLLGRSKNQWMKVAAAAHWFKYEIVLHYFFPSLLRWLDPQVRNFILIPYRRP